MTDNSNQIPPATNDNTVDSTPNPAYTELATAIIRHLLSFAAGIGIISSTTMHSIPDVVITDAASIIVLLGTLVWSLYQKYQSEKKAHAGAIASANAQKPLKVIKLLKSA